MADLMSATHTYEKLKKTYKDFFVPAAKFTIGGKDIFQLKGIRILSVEAVLSIRETGSVRVIVGNCYDYKNGTFFGEIKELLVLGKEVELSLGYASSLQKLFKGYLAATGMIFDGEDGIALELTALDVRRLMMSDNFHIREHKITNYSDAVRDIMKRYQKLCKVKIEDTSEKMKEGQIYQHNSDYDFIVRDLIESGLVDREFFVVADTAYFRKPKSVSAPVLTLGIGRGILRFARFAEYENQKIQVVGFDHAAGNAVTGQAQAKASDSMVDVLGAPGERIVTNAECASSAQAENQAKALAGRLLAKRQRAQASCIGLPEIIPGRFIQLERVDSLMNQKYYITKVTHTCDSEGFRTDFWMEGWE